MTRYCKFLFVACEVLYFLSRDCLMVLTIHRKGLKQHREMSKSCYYGNRIIPTIRHTRTHNSHHYRRLTYRTTIVQYGATKGVCFLTQMYKRVKF